MRKVGSVTLAGIRLPIFRKAFETDEGWTEADKIVVTDYGPPDRQEDTFAHETFHALLDHSGIAFWIRKRFKLGKREYKEFEEELIRRLVPHLLSAWRSVGWLRRLPWVK